MSAFFNEQSYTPRQECEVSELSHVGGHWSPQPSPLQHCLQERSPSCLHASVGLLFGDPEPSPSYFGTAHGDSQPLQTLPQVTLPLLSSDLTQEQSRMQRLRKTNARLLEKIAAALETVQKVDQLVPFTPPPSFPQLSEGLSEPQSCPRLELHSELHSEPQSDQHSEPQPTVGSVPDSVLIEDKQNLRNCKGKGKGKGKDTPLFLNSPPQDLADLLLLLREAVVREVEKWTLQETDNRGLIGVLEQYKATLQRVVHQVGQAEERFSELCQTLWQQQQQDKHKLQHKLKLKQKQKQKQKQKHKESKELNGRREGRSQSPQRLSRQGSVRKLTRHKSSKRASISKTRAKERMVDTEAETFWPQLGPYFVAPSARIEELLAKAVQSVHRIPTPENRLPKEALLNVHGINRLAAIAKMLQYCKDMCMDVVDFQASRIYSKVKAREKQRRALSELQSVAVSGKTATTAWHPNGDLPLDETMCYPSLEELDYLLPLQSKELEQIVMALKSLIVSPLAADISEVRELETRLNAIADRNTDLCGKLRARIQSTPHPPFPTSTRYEMAHKKKAASTSKRKTCKRPDPETERPLDSGSLKRRSPQTDPSVQPLTQADTSACTGPKDDSGSPPEVQRGLAEKGTFATFLVVPFKPEPETQARPSVAAKPVSGKTFQALRGLTPFPSHNPSQRQRPSKAVPAQLSSEATAMCHPRSTGRGVAN